MARPEYLILSAGAVSFIGGWRKEGQFPSHTTEGLIGTIALVLVASATNGSKLQPVVTGIAWLMLLAALYGTARAYKKPAKTPRSQGDAHDG